MRSFRTIKNFLPHFVFSSFSIIVRLYSLFLRLLILLPLQMNAKPEFRRNKAFFFALLSPLLCVAMFFFHSLASSTHYKSPHIKGGYGFFINKTRVTQLPPSQAYILFGNQVDYTSHRARVLMIDSAAKHRTINRVPTFNVRSLKCFSFNTSGSWRKRISN